jgi:hypothetical protein
VLYFESTVHCTAGLPFFTLSVSSLFAPPIKVGSNGNPLCRSFSYLVEIPYCAHIPETATVSTERSDMEGTYGQSEGEQDH